MPELSGFFDSRYVNGIYDRVYNANSFASYFSSFISNGVFVGREQELLVKSTSPAASMAISVLPGRAYIKGYWYQSSEEKTLQISAANQNNPRIDSIVVELNTGSRTIGLKVLTGTPAINPEPPTLSENQIQLAKILIPVGKVAIINSDIIDTRWDKTVCGAVGAIVNQIDTDAFYDQVNDLCRYYYGLAEGSYNAYLSQLQDLINVMEQTIISGDLSAMQVELNKKLNAPYKNIAEGLVYQDVNNDTYLVSAQGLGGEVTIAESIDVPTDGTPVEISIPNYRRNQKIVLLIDFEIGVTLNNSSGAMAARHAFDVSMETQHKNFRVNSTWPQSLNNGTEIKSNHTCCCSFTIISPTEHELKITCGQNIVNGSTTTCKCKVTAILINHDTSASTSALFTSDNKLVVTSDDRFISPK